MPRTKSPVPRVRPARPAGRRGWRPIALLAALALVAVACSDPPTAGDGEAARTGNGNGNGADLPECPLGALDDASGPVEVTVWYGGFAGATKETMDGMVKAFNGSQDQVQVTASDQGQSYDEVYRKYSSAASASTDQLPDVILLEDTQLQGMVDRGQVLPAESCMEAADYDPTQILPAVRAKYTVDDVLYPGYMNLSTPVLYYNKAHWVKAGLDPDDPPETMDELVEQAQALKDAGVSDQPFALKNTRWFFETWMNGVGVDMVNERNGRGGQATEATFDTPEARDLFTLLQDMDDEGLLNDFANTEGSIDHYLSLVNEQSSMLIETSTAATTISAVLEGDLTAADAGIDFDDSVVDKNKVVPASASFPGIESPGGVFASGSGFYILNTSADAKQAGSWKFLEFMLQPENAKEWLFSGSYLPIVKSVLDEDDVDAFWTGELSGVLLKPSYEQIKDADPDKPGPLVGPYPDYADELEKAMDAMLLSGADVESTLAKAQENVTAALERYAGD